MAAFTIEKILGSASHTMPQHDQNLVVDATTSARSNSTMPSQLCPPAFASNGQNFVGNLQKDGAFPGNLWQCGNFAAHPLIWLHSLRTLQGMWGIHCSENNYQDFTHKFTQNHGMAQEESSSHFQVQQSSFMMHPNAVNNGNLRRAVFSDSQRKGLENRFKIQKYIGKPERKKLAEQLGLTDSQKVPCPVCRAETTLPAAGLPLNFDFANIVRKNLEKRDKAVGKDKNRTKEAVYSCTCCGKQFDVAQICVCLDCGADYICFPCMGKEHRSHDWQMVSELIELRKNQWKRFCDTQLEPILSQLESSSGQHRAAETQAVGTVEQIECALAACRNALETLNRKASIVHRRLVNDITTKRDENSIGDFSSPTEQNNNVWNRLFVKEISDAARAKHDHEFVMLQLTNTNRSLTKLLDELTSSVAALQEGNTRSRGRENVRDGSRSRADESVDREIDISRYENDDDGSLSHSSANGAAPNNTSSNSSDTSNASASAAPTAAQSSTGRKRQATSSARSSAPGRQPKRTRRSRGAGASGTVSLRTRANSRAGNNARADTSFYNSDEAEAM